MSGEILVINTDDNFKSHIENETFSVCFQDLFVVEIMNQIQEGFFVDIGSAHCFDNNNSFLLEKKYNWKGLCVEYEPKYNDSYSIRNCKYINDDALKLNYEQIYKENQFPNAIDYLSLDIDDLTTSLLSIIPFDSYEYKIIMIEHDFYLNGNKYLEQQRDFLTKKGYHLLFGDIFVELHNFEKEKSFEDWWINPKFFDSELIKKLTRKSIYPSEALKLVRKYK